MYILKKYYYLLFVFFIFCCSDQTIYSGKIINEENIDISEIDNKNMLLSILGEPSYIDPIEKKYFYFSEKKKFKNHFSKKIESRILFVFKFDENENIIFANQFNLNNEKDLKYVKETTPNAIVKRGLIERIFGGVGTTQLPNTSK